mmetsp:Transcript_49325/g.140924  ORF Transcript_49325/g.140924 Transcript_49325/m.140924 type:complete len:370 (+) Transcript_49325:413-1522(+)
MASLLVPDPRHVAVPRSVEPLYVLANAHVEDRTHPALLLREAQIFGPDFLPDKIHRTLFRGRWVVQHRDTASRGANENLVLLPRPRQQCRRPLREIQGPYRIERLRVEDTDGAGVASDGLRRRTNNQVLPVGGNADSRLFLLGRQVPECVEWTFRVRQHPAIPDLYRAVQRARHHGAADSGLAGEGDVAHRRRVRCPQDLVWLHVPRLLEEQLHRAVGAAARDRLAVYGVEGAAGRVEPACPARGAADADSPLVEALEHVDRGQQLVHTDGRGVEVPDAKRPVQRRRDPLLRIERVPDPTGQHLRVALRVGHVPDVHVPLDGVLDGLRGAIPIVYPGVGVGRHHQNHATRLVESKRLHPVPLGGLHAAK